MTATVEELYPILSVTPTHCSADASLTVKVVDVPGAKRVISTWKLAIPRAVWHVSVQGSQTSVLVPVTTGKHFDH